MDIPENLQSVADHIRETGQPRKETVRTLLSWFGHQKRGRIVVSTVRAALREAGLRTEPSFESAWIDGILLFTLDTDGADAAEATQAEGDEPEGLEDPVARLRMLPAANRPPKSVKRDETVDVAVTVMLMNDFSQLPVMSSDRMVDGMISWRSIGRVRARNKPCAFVRDCLEDHRELPEQTPLLEAIARVAEHEVVLVRGQDRRITGIVTTTDLSLQFHELAEPFLLLAEIENQVRRLIDGCFSSADLAKARHPGDEERSVEGVADLTFGEYARLLENPENWKRLELALDRKHFVSQLQKVRTIRNDVMHFSPDGVSPEDLELLRDMVRFLQQVH